MAHVDLGSQLLARVREDIDETAKIEAMNQRWKAARW